VGRTGGRPPKLTDDDIEAAKAMLANPEIGVTQIAPRLGVSPAVHPGRANREYTGRYRRVARRSVEHNDERGADGKRFSASLVER
jgi:Helix-turn-helix domain of resolvase